MGEKILSMTSLVILLFLVSLSGAFLIRPVAAIVIRVPQDAPTINTAIEMAYDGDTIQVAAGTYYEHVNVTKSVTLVGEASASTIIDGGGTGYVVYVTADNVRINRFTVQNGDRGIYLKRVSGCTVDGNIVSNNYMGVSLSYSNSNVISGNTVLSNRYGIKVYHSSENTINNNEVSNGYYGIYLSSNSSRNTISGNTVTSNNYYGVSLSDSNSCTLNYNVVSGSKYGIQLWYSGGGVLRNNQISGNSYNFWVYGMSVADYIQDIETSNTVEGKPIYYVVNKAYWEVPSDAGYVSVINSTNIAVRGITLTNNYHGLLLAYTDSSTIENVETSNNLYGIKLFFSNNITINGCTVTFNKDFGIRLYRSNSTTISGNIIESNARYGLYLYYSSGNILTGNILTGNKYNFGVDGDSLLDYTQDIDTSNTVDGKPIYYWINKHNQQVPINAGYVAVVNSTNITVRDSTLTKNEHGVLFAHTNSSTIENVQASDNQRGIDIQHSNDNTISGNTVTSSIWYGIYLYSSMNNILINNDMLNNTYNFGVYGTSLPHFIHAIDTLNTVDGKPIYYWINQHNRQVPPNAGYVGAINSTNIIVKDLTLIDNYQGVLFAYTTSSTIQKVNVSSNRFGIYLDHSSGNTITNSTILKNHYRGIYFYDSNSNVVSENTLTSNEVGIKMHWHSNGNTIYHNSFINNTQQAHSEYSTNTWDNGYPSGGNYWNDYTGVDVKSGPNQDQFGSDGIGDTPYVIDASNQDDYPLIKPYGGPHDIGIKHITTSKTIVGQGYNLYIDTKIINYGIYTESFSITAYANTIIIQTKAVTLTRGNSTTITLTWNTTGVTKGNYTIKAEATPVPGETDTTDNTLTDDTVLVTVPGDTNGDRVVDMKDVFAMILAFGARPGMPKWNPACDINNDNVVDMKDIFIAIRNFGKKW